jgi:hypothetical protein
MALKVRHNYMKKTDKILQDLYEIDITLKEKPLELGRVVNELLLLKPDTHFDFTFAEKLREDLAGHVEEIVAGPASSPSIRPISSPFPKRPMLSPYISALKVTTKAWYSLGVMALLVLVMVPFLNKQPTSILSQKINPIGSAKFGTLSYNSKYGTAGGPMIASDMIGIPEARTAAYSSSLGSAPTSYAPVEVPATYSYVYEGESLALADTEAPVYRRVPGFEEKNALGDLLDKADFDAVDLNSFDKLKPRNVELKEDKDGGYSIGVNFDEGTVSIVPPSGEIVPVAPSGSEAGPMATSSMATSSPTAAATSTTEFDPIAEAAAIAGNFIQQHSVDMSSYGTPIVKNDPASNNIVRVIYPLLIDKTPAVDDMSAPFGVEVTIDIAKRTITNVGNLTSQTYESSSYRTVTDQTKIMDAIRARQLPIDKDFVGSTTVRLGTPKKVLMRYVDAKDDGSTSNELYVPALQFPVLNAVAKDKSITVPLVEELITPKKDK